jgi:hypothetical protein
LQANVKDAVLDVDKAVGASVMDVTGYLRFPTK